MPDEDSFSHNGSDDVPTGGADWHPAASRAAQERDVDQTLSESDQTASDGDQTASDADQTAADVDQAQAEADQRASDTDQAAADREHEIRGPVQRTNGTYEAARAERMQGTLARDQTTRTRELMALDRFEQAAHRDEHAHRRDLNAQARDEAAERQDVDSAVLEVQLAVIHHSAGDAREHAAGIRDRARADRARAAQDRERAANDRDEATRDRAQLQAELRHAQHDGLTGAFGRELGTVALEQEMNRARHADGRLVLAFVDVDALKALNDRHGHPAGDILLRDVVIAIQTHLRSYDPVVRIGGDEFICGLGDTGLDEARQRFERIRATIALSHPETSISVGFAELCSDDTLDDLRARGDKDLYEAKPPSKPQAV